MYPRFIQIILKHKYPNFPRSGELLNLTHVGKRVFVDMRRAKEKVSKAEDENDNFDPKLYTPHHTDLFGQLLDPAYVADANGNDPPGYIALADVYDNEDVNEKAQQQPQALPEVQAPEPQEQEQLNPQTDDQNPEAEAHGEFNVRSQEVVTDADFNFDFEEGLDIGAVNSPPIPDDEGVVQDASDSSEDDSSSSSSDSHTEAYVNSLISSSSLEIEMRKRKTNEDDNENYNPPLEETVSRKSASRFRI
jgi:hypothetical protein